MKRVLITMCALAALVAGALPICAAESAKTQTSRYYPVSVEEYTAGSLDELRMDRVYQLSLTDDPNQIPTDDFVRNGRRYYLLDMTRKDEVGVDTKTYTQTVTQPSDTSNMEKVLQKLDSEIEVTTEDGYTGVLHLDHTTVQVKADGYATKTSTVSASRTYPNLSDADTSLLPKTIEDNGRTLTLSDVQWSSSSEDRYTASASYTGTASSQYATGYTVTADYSGEVAKNDCDIVTYTATFGSTEVLNETGILQPGIDFAGLKRPLTIGGLVIAAAFGGTFIFKKVKGRRQRY